jgi:GPI ethanolamine phosphate transferase 1
MPTESRPGHVAMIAGFYEDISAIAKGWKENPVEFDSVFNRTRYTWTWGSPDILTMFSKSSSNVFAYTYDSKIEDFAAENASVLDTWVLHNFKKFIYHSEVNKTQTQMLNEDNNCFFFHLLGIDTNGHAKKPHSNEYQSNIVYVDSIVEEITNKINDYYNNDNKTVFIFTSDHGMTDWGSHGSGDDSETLTPFVAWGAGIKDINYSSQNLVNIQQVDIAPLMSHLIGIPIPINSIGKLPLSLLDSNQKDKCTSFKMNALQIIEQLKVKHRQCKDKTIYFQEYKHLTMANVHEMIDTIDLFISLKKYDEAIDKINSLIDLSLAALDYYHKYNKFYLGICIVLSCLAWIIYLFIHNFGSFNSQMDVRTTINKNNIINKLCTLLIVISIGASFYQQFPFTYYFYTLTPIILWRSVLIKSNSLNDLFHLWCENKVANSINVFILLIGIEFLVLTFFYRWIFSALLLVYSIVLMFNLKIKQNQVCFCFFYCLLNFVNELILFVLRCVKRCFLYFVHCY